MVQQNPGSNPQQNPKGQGSSVQGHAGVAKPSTAPQGQQSSGQVPQGSGQQSPTQGQQSAGQQQARQFQQQCTQAGVPQDLVQRLHTALPNLNWANLWAAVQKDVPLAVAIIRDILAALSS